MLFDWRGTLVTSPGFAWAVEEALVQVGRPAGAAPSRAVLDAVRAVDGVDDRLDAPGMDADAALHRDLTLAVYRDAGLDAALGAALYATDAAPGYNLFATDVRRTLHALKQRGIATAVVSDIHFDIRPLFADAGCDGLVDVFTLSYEQRIQKPDPRMFTRTLDALGVAPDQALMVGDRSRPDGAAVEVGIPTLLLPPLTRPDDERLHLVLALCDSGGSGT